VKKNAILQIDHMNNLRAKGMDRLAAIMQGNADRLRPILMTTLTLVAGMLPLAVGTGPGAEERRAVAVVVIGGQTLCLLLTLLVTPVVYSCLDDLAKDDDERAEHELFRNERAFRAVLVIFAKELVAAWIERRDFDHCRLTAGNHLLGIKVVALELLGRWIAICNFQSQILTGRHLKLRGLEAMVLDREREVVGSDRRSQSHDSGQGQGKQQAH